MQEPAQQLNSSLEAEHEHLKKILKDPQVLAFFLKQLELLPKDSYEVNVTFERIYILIYLNKYTPNNLERESSDSSLQGEQQSKYVIKINRNFPLEQSVRVHLLDGPFQPKVSDSRDLFASIMGREYHYSIRLKEVIDQLLAFDRKLHSINQNYLQLQRIGHFILGETYFYHQLSEMFSSLTMLKDHSQKKSSIYVGITETHILFFKELIDKHQHAYLSPLRHHHSLIVKNEKELLSETEVTYYRLRLISCGELQCIESILYRESEKTVRVILKKYKSIKVYQEAEDIKRQYKFHRPELFLRGILKFITKFQPCEITFQPHFGEVPSKKAKKGSSSPSKGKEQQALSHLMSTSLRLQDQLKKEPILSLQKAKIGSINKIYQKIIEHYSARANPYYLIFVNKLNLIYQKYYLTTTKVHKDEPQTNQ